ncbi:hypothetical protein CEE36_03285 [candidate division TA06 bacterium B3_TA06]|uniref:Sporulation stage II protein D amidase enhancer LytB N-terminal domain-containing protein n=1 Tax=candidate division TA06 bacterium B3_TA06 TaxID=2012487 RepID=A0A532V934_UNCT6|nr:MAG: hypothetical protein CEE36_03285 [candidate division TA06 bacterium B3_TA06]
MLSIKLIMIILGVNVNILSSYHPSQVTVIAGDRKGKLTAKGNTIYVNSKSIERYGCSADSFTLKWQDKTRSYAGSLEVWAEDGELILVNKVEEDAYLASVVGAEMVPGAELEALKAQVVLCRTFIYTGCRHQDEPWDLCDLTHCQSYRGLETVTAATGKAVAETEGMFLTYHGEPCKIYYHSTSGGRTADARSIWPDEYAPYLCSVPDPYCSASPHYSWRCTLTSSQIAQALDITHVSDIEVVESAPDNRVIEIRVRGSESVIYLGWQFRMIMTRKLGWGTLKSSWFEVRKDGEDFVFTGHGLGHGVGLSQWGAVGMAEQGATFKEILAHYYPGTEVKRW